MTSKLRANIDAIGIIKALDGKPATSEEKAKLAKFSGWGALSQAFDDDKADRVEGGEIETRRATAERYRTSAASNSYYAGEVERQTSEAQKLENWKNQWHEAHQQIKSLLSEAEYRAAKRSTINAHFTSPEIIGGMWDIAQWLGFQGGNVLEPGAGIGHFFGLMPEAIADKSRLFGVELDSYTAKILKALYPEADIQNTGFQTADIADNSIDLAISNVPFANVPVVDKALEAMGGPVENLHDYFFGKTLTKLKPGGLQIFITSAFTMDKGNPEIRKWLSERADLVAAYRLPNDAFQANAGTQVVTDIIVMRKKDGKHFPQAQDWTSLADATTHKGEALRVNQYFASHPQNILGLLDNDGSMFAGREGDKKEMTVHSDPSRPAKVALQQALATLPRGIVGSGSLSTDARTGLSSVKMGNIISRDGKYRFQGNETPDPDLNDPKNAARVSGFLDVRDALNRQYDLELSETATAEQIEANRRGLNQSYDAFHAKFENFHNRKNKSLFLDDPDYFRLLGSEIESNRDKGAAASVLELVKRAAGKRTYVKADIFSKRVLEPRSEPTRADSVEDAFGISLGWRGQVDAGFIAELTGHTVDQVERSLIEREIAVRDPETGRILSREQYLSGNVRKKLEIARESGADYRRNVGLLESVQPQDVGISDVRFKIGATWIPAQVYSDFLGSLGVSGVNISYLTGKEGGGTDRWEIDGKKSRTHGVVYKEFQTDAIGIEEIMDSLLNFQKITITAKDAKGGRVTDEAATAQARETAKKLNAKFIDWVRTNEATGTELAKIYNREVNSYAQRTYDGQFLTFPWANRDFDIFPDKKNTVWRAIQDGFGLIAHGVGGGKTIVGSAIALEMRRLGMARKPMIVVHNATLEGFAKEMARMAPTARVLVGRKDELQGDKRREFLMRIAAGDWDAVVIAHSTFSKIADDAQVEMDTMQNLVDEMMESLADQGYDSVANAKADRKKSPTVKNLVKQIERLEAAITKASTREVDEGLLNFQQLGVDALIVDEVHQFKKMPFSTKLDAKGIDGAFSQRGYALLMRARNIQEKMGGKNIFTMTGTPVTNTLGEIWNMVRLVAPKLLKDYNIEHFDQFVSKFAEVETVSEMGPTGDFKSVDRLSKVVNLPEWATFLRMAADVKLGDDLVVKNRPGIKGGKPELVAVERSAGVSQWVGYIRSVLDEFSKLTGKDLAENPRLSAIPVQAYMASRAAAIDIRLVEPRAKDEPASKVNVMLDRLMGIYEKTTPYSGTQVIFADSFNQQKISLFDALVSGNALEIEIDPEKGPGTEFNLYEDIRSKLIARGVPESEIAVITDSKWGNDARKQALFELVNEGKVRIIIGSTQRLGTGVNMQKLMASAHHLDVPWTPAELEQRDGRVYRQGNIHGEMGSDIELLRYGMKDTLDAALWQKLETKQRFITLSLSGKIVGRELEEVDEIMTLAEQRAVLSGPYGQQMFELDTRLKELDAARLGFAREAQNRKAEIASAANHLRVLDARAERLRPSLDKMRDLSRRIKSDGASVSVGGVVFETRAETAAAVDSALDSARGSFQLSADGTAQVPAVTGISVNGVPIYLHPETTFSEQLDQETGAVKMVPKISFDLISSASDKEENITFGRVSSSGTLWARMEELGESVDSLQSSIANNSERLRQLASMSEAGAWPMQGEYDETSRRLAEVRDMAREERAHGPVLSSSSRNGQDLLDLGTYRNPGELDFSDKGKTPGELVKANLGLATTIAGDYFNITGVERDDVIQQARAALVKAARAFDPARGAKFSSYAGAAMRNELNSLYGRQTKISRNEVASLDERMGPDSTETRQDMTPDRTERGPLGIERAETSALLEEAISSLPDKPQQVVRLSMQGLSGEEIGARLGMSRQRVNIIMGNAHEVLRQKLARKGIRGQEEGVLFSSPRSELDDLMADLRRDMPSLGEIESMRQRANAEPEGARTIGVPAKAKYSPDTETRRSTDVIQQLREDRMVRQTEQGWIDEARAMLKSDREGVKKTLLRKALNPENGTFTAAEVKAAQILVPELMRRAFREKSLALRKEAFALAWAYDAGGSEQARAFAARRDPFQSPAERHTEFLTKLISTPTAAQRKDIESAPTPKERQSRLESAQAERLARVEKALADMGIKLEDIFSGEAYVRLKGTAMVENALAGLDARKRKAIRLIQDQFPDAEIARVTGFTVPQIRAIETDFMARLSARLDELGDAALDLKNFDIEALFSSSRPEESLTPAERERRKAEILRAMGFGRAESRNKKELIKRRKPKRQYPVESYSGPAPSEDPVQAERLRQMGLEWDENRKAWNRNPKLPSDAVLPIESMKQERIRYDTDQPWEYVKFDPASKDQVIRAARMIQAADGNAIDMFYEAWMNSILSGPQTHVTNILGNGAMGLWEYLVQRPMEAAINTAVGDKDSTQMGELSHIYRAAMPGVMAGWRAAVRAFGAEHDFFENDVLNAQIEFKDFDKGGGGRAAIGGTAGRIVRVPGRALMAMDGFFKYATGQMEAAGQAYRIAAAQGLTGEGMEAEIRTQVNMPGSLAWQRAVSKAKDLTFQQELPEFMKKVSALRSTNAAPTLGGKLMSLALGMTIPFIKTPYNIFRTGLRKSPLGALNVMAHIGQGLYSLKNGRPFVEGYSKAQLVRDMAEQTLAFGATALLLGAIEGDPDDDKKWLLITGGRPYGVDKQGERDLLNRTSGGPYQIRIGGRNGFYFNYGRLDPFATTTGTVATAVRLGKTQGTVKDWADRFFANMASQATDKTFMQGIENVVATIDGITTQGTSKTLEKSAKGLLSSLVPNLIRQPIRNWDDAVRDGKYAGLGYTLTAAPALAEQRSDLYGQPVVKQGNALSRMFFPAGIVPTPIFERGDQFLAAYNRASDTPYTPERTKAYKLKDARGESVAMTGAQIADFDRRSGMLFAQKLKSWLTPAVISHPTEEHQKQFAKDLADARLEIKERIHPVK